MIFGQPVYVGSSPHARGALESMEEVACNLGIIPACAGSTSGWPCRRWRCRDHPRMRGEHRTHRSECALAWGSSPHARGARAVAAERTTAAGIIPACAGSTRAFVLPELVGGDHPRMRGEHKMSGTPDLVFRGSSPHARGARDILSGFLQAVGIIPACAGST